MSSAPRQVQVDINESAPTMLMKTGDETRPVCKACSKKNRPCQWDELHTKFKNYRPNEFASSSRSAAEDDEGSNARDDLMEVDGVESDEGVDGTVQSEGGSDAGLGHDHSRNTSPRRKNSRTDASESRLTSVSSPSAQLSPGSPYTVPMSKSTTGGVPISSLLQSHNPDRIPEGSRVYSPQPIPLAHGEALLVHHYTEHLGRWLDCTDATRQFTLGVPEKVKHCPVLCHAVLSFAARHSKKDTTADLAYQRCIALLIERLNEDAASHDETLLCAIVILRFYEQLNVSSNTGSDEEQHLTGCSAIIRSSQGHHYVDPSAPTLREAAFWVYVRQCLYNATINQAPLDIDFSLQLHPTPSSMRDAHPLARLRLETAWANQMTWNLACVVNFCFDGPDPQNEKTHKMRRWQELWDLVQEWIKGRPEGFNAIFEGPAGDLGSFPEIWFTADWHVLSFGFYHFACIMLLRYKPGPKFAIRTVGSLSETDHEILSHARAICGASKSSPETVPLAIAVCHTIFIWGPLVFNPKERIEIVQILTKLEKNHVWPTTWIINALKKEWGVPFLNVSHDELGDAVE